MRHAVLRLTTEIGVRAAESLPPKHPMVTAGMTAGVVMIGAAELGVDTRVVQLRTKATPVAILCRRLVHRGVRGLAAEAVHLAAWVAVIFGARVCKGCTMVTASATDAT